MPLFANDAFGSESNALKSNARFPASMSRANVGEVTHHSRSNEPRNERKMLNALMVFPAPTVCHNSSPLYGDRGVKYVAANFW